MTSFDQLALENLGEAQIWIGTGYTRVAFRGLEVMAWWFHPWEISIAREEPEEQTESC